MVMAVSHSFFASREKFENCLQDPTLARKKGLYPTLVDVYVFSDVIVSSDRIYDS